MPHTPDTKYYQFTFFPTKTDDCTATFTVRGQDKAEALFHLRQAFSSGLQQCKKITMNDLTDIHIRQIAKNSTAAECLDRLKEK
jgi:hypothetical protein